MFAASGALVGPSAFSRGGPVVVRFWSVCVHLSSEGGHLPLFRGPPVLGVQGSVFEAPSPFAARGSMVVFAVCFVVSCIVCSCVFGGLIRGVRAVLGSHLCLFGC